MMKKIIYCIPALANSGGMERVLSIKANHLVALGYDVSIITSDQMNRAVFFPLDERIKRYDLGVNHEASNGSFLKKILGYPKRHLKHKRALSKLLKELKADVVVSMFGDEASFLPSIKDGSRKVLEYHFSKNKRLQYGRTGLWRKIDEWRTKQDEEIVQQFDDFVVLTQEDKELWGNLDNIKVIPNPLTFDSPETARLSHKRIIAAGRLDFQKHFDALIDIWAKLAPKYPDWRLDIYGSGSDRELLQTQIERLGIEQSIALQKPTKDIQKEYLKSSIYVMTSRYEGLPMVLLEAQTMGLPIVAYACQCGPRDIITEGENGFLIEPYDEDLFIEKLSALIEDEELRKQMGKKAKANTKHYQIEQVMPQWEALFNQKNKTL